MQSPSLISGLSLEVPNLRCLHERLTTSREELSQRKFEEDYRVQLKGYMTIDEFEEVITTINRLWRSTGSGLVNRGCLLCCMCCCFVVMRKDNREALDEVRFYIENINRQIYLARGMRWMILSETGEDGEEEDVMLALDIEGLVDQQPIKRRMSLEYHMDPHKHRASTSIL